jgi:hypothetical protein
MKILNRLFIGVAIITGCFVFGCSVKSSQEPAVADPAVLAENDETPYAKVPATEILQQTRKKYKSLRHYSALVSTEFTTSYPSGETKEDKIESSLEFEAPAKIKLKWTEKDREKEFTLPNVRNPRPNTDEANWALTDAAKTDAYQKMFWIVPGLFGVASKMKSVADIMIDPQIVNEEEIYDRDHYVVEGDIRLNLGTITLWIDKSDFLIRRMKRHYSVEGGFFETRETYFDLEVE